MKRRLFWVVAAVFLVECFDGAFASRAFACRPVPMPSLEDNVRKSDAIFVGKVIAVDDSLIPAIGPTILKQGYERVLFSVTDVWKGSVKSEVVVSVGNRVCDIVREFHKDEDFLIYASSGTFDSLEAPYSTRTRRLALAAEDIEALGKSQTPTERADLKAWFYLDAYGPEVTLAIVAVAMLGTFLLRRGNGNWRRIEG